MALLAPSPNPSALLSSTSGATILELLSPALTYSLYFAAVFQQLLSTTTLFLSMRTYVLSLLLLRQASYASHVLLIQSYYASSLCLKQLCPVVKAGVEQGWTAMEKFRNKLFFEFMVFVLGPGGNSVLLLVFWPGWFVVGGGVWGIRWACG
jgi:hypothetical protein